MARPAPPLPISPRAALRTAWVVFSALLVAACTQQADLPYLRIVGGGFVFNYRLATATAGVLVAAEKELPEQATVEVSMENPAGGAPITLDPVVPGSFEFVTPPLSGIEAGKEYRVTVRLVGPDGKEVEKIEKTFRSQVDQSVLPEKPLTIGPGYEPNPEARPEPAGAN
jgi:hypothetical protein